jgi:hypothetical protein
MYKDIVDKSLFHRTFWIRPPGYVSYTGGYIVIETSTQKANILYPNRYIEFIDPKLYTCNNPRSYEMTQIPMDLGHFL